MSALNTEELLRRMQAAREAIVQASDTLVKAAQALGQPDSAWSPQPALSEAVGRPTEDPLSVVRAFLGDGEAPCSCAGTMDGDPVCLYCGSKEEAREALERLSEAEYAKGHDAGAEGMRAACKEEVHNVLRILGVTDADLLWKEVTEAIEGATP